LERYIATPARHVPSGCHICLTDIIREHSQFAGKKPEIPLDSTKKVGIIANSCLLHWRLEVTNHLTCFQDWEDWIMNRKTLLFPVVCFTVLCFMLAGCGGHKGGGMATPPIDGTGELTTSDPVLGDGSHYDALHFRASHSGAIVIEMNRSGGNPVGDPYVMVYEGGSDDRSKNTFLGSNDDWNGLDSAYQLYAEADTEYTVFFNVLSSSTKLGTYSYHVYEGYRGVRADNAPSGQDKKPADVNAKLAIHEP